MIAFALFISVANATATDLVEGDDAGAPVPEASMESMEPTPEPAPVVEAPAPVVEPAPVVDPAPVVEPEPAPEPAPAPVVEPIVEESIASDAQQPTAPAVEEAPDEQVATLQGSRFCDARSNGGWGLETGTASGNDVDDNPAFNHKLFVRNGKVYDGVKIAQNNCSSTGAYVADVDEILEGSITACHPTNQTWNTTNAAAGGHFGHADDIVPAYSYYNGSAVLVNVAAKNWATIYTRSGRTATGEAIHANGCEFPPPPDLCTNIPGNQSSVPAGNTSTGGVCRRDVLANGDVTFCEAEYFLFWITGYRAETGDLATIQSHDFWHGGDIFPAYSYFDSTGTLKSVAASGNQQYLTWGCSTTAPPPADVCDNVPGNQPTPPAGTDQVGVNCVAPGVSCDPLDQTGVDTGSTQYSLPGDGRFESCAPRPTLCDPGEGLRDANLNGVNDGCTEVVCDAGEGKADNPSPLNAILDTCVDIRCDQGEGTIDDGPLHNGVMDTCTPKYCDPLDEFGIDRGTDGVLNGVFDSCGVTPATCSSLTIPIDTNANGNPDTCATLVAQTQCRVRNDDGGITVRWQWTNRYGVPVTAPISDGDVNWILGAAAQTQPSTFAPGSGIVEASGNSSGLVWYLTGGSARGSLSSAACFVDQCSNSAYEPGDQPSIPAGLVRSGVNDCVTAAPTCAFDQVGTDDGQGTGTRIAGDGISDGCVDKPDVTCKSDEVATNTNPLVNATLDTCVPKPGITNADCQSDERARDTTGNGTLDTCVPRPDVNCLLAVGVDSNGNGSKDTCVQITPIIDCGTYEANGSSRTLSWRWRNATPYTVTVPVGARNAFFSANQPTVFAPGEGATFTSTLTRGFFGGLSSQSWFITGNTAIGFWSSALTPRCFPDACANLVGDQRGPGEGQAVNNAGNCVPEVTDCDADQVLEDANEDGVNDGCVGVPAKCPSGVWSIDTNDNRNADLCVTVTPVLDCATNLGNGDTLVTLHAVNETAHTFSVPVGDSNSLVGASGSVPTSFPIGSTDTFDVVIPAGSAGLTWTLTGISLAASAESTPCFEDACPNAELDPGDQDGVPEGRVVNNVGACVDAPPTCQSAVTGEQVPIERVATLRLTEAKPTVATDETPRDTNGDGVADVCDPIACASDHLGTDTSGNGIADLCVANPVTCDPATHDAKDLVPGGAPNGVADTCVAKAAPVSASGTPTPTPDTPAPGDAANSGPGIADGGEGEQPIVEDEPAEEAASGDAPGDGAGAEGEPVEGGDGDDLPFTGMALGMLVLLGMGGVIGGIGFRADARREDRRRARQS